MTLREMLKEERKAFFRSRRLSEDEKLDAVLFTAFIHQLQERCNYMARVAGQLAWPAGEEAQDAARRGYEGTAGSDKSGKHS